VQQTPAGTGVRTTYMVTLSKLCRNLAAMRWHARCNVSEAWTTRRSGSERRQARRRARRSSASALRTALAWQMSAAARSSRHGWLRSRHGATRSTERRASYARRNGLRAVAPNRPTAPDEAGQRREHVQARAARVARCVRAWLHRGRAMVVHGWV